MNGWSNPPASQKTTGKPSIAETPNVCSRGSKLDRELNPSQPHVSSCGGDSIRESRRLTMKDATNSEPPSTEPTRRQAIVGVAIAFGGLALVSTKSWAAADDEISHTTESIHQELEFKTSRKRLYAPLTP